MKCVVDNISWGIDKKLIIEDIKMRAEAGKITGIIGPNGSGKTTLLKNIYRVLRPQSGTVFIDATDLKNLSIRESSRLMSVVSQEEDGQFDFSVFEVIMMGRYPYKKSFEAETKEDRKIVSDAMMKTDLCSMEERRFMTLSGGEKQRVLIARALAQQADLLIMDEPTNHLDIRYKLQIFDIVKELNISVVATIHDINIGAQYCDILYVMRNGRVFASGMPNEILTGPLIMEVFGVQADISPDPLTDRPRIYYTGSTTGGRNAKFASSSRGTCPGSVHGTGNHLKPPQE